jgi:hypothetical protein
MDLRKYNLSYTQIQSLLGDGCYQPFIFSNDFMAGICYSWLTGDLIIAMDRTNDIAYQWTAPNNPLKPIKGYINNKNWNLFVDCNRRLGKMYDDWINYTLKMIDNSSDFSVIDTAANAGYFLYRFKENGAGKCVGYDLLNFSKEYNILNLLTGFDVEFIHRPYDMGAHTIRDSHSADIVISSAIMCHLSDPLHYLKFLATITKKVLVLFTSVDDTETYHIIYDGAKKFNPDAQFPNCFDQNTRISKGLLFFGLREAGFLKIIEIPYKDTWIPFANYKQFKTVIAVK